MACRICRPAVGRTSRLAGDQGCRENIFEGQQMTPAVKSAALPTRSPSDVGGTSRSIFSAFYDAMQSSDDPLSGGYPQIAALYTTRKPQVIGLGPVVMQRAKKNKNLSSARHDDQIGFRFRSQAPLQKSSTKNCCDAQCSSQTGDQAPHSVRQPSGRGKVAAIQLRYCLLFRLRPGPTRECEQPLGEALS